MKDLKELDEKIKEKSEPNKVEDYLRFFKTGKGEYGEGDKFIGMKVPEQRKIAKEFKDIPINEVEKLLDSEIHEKRLIGLLILIQKLKKASSFRKDYRNVKDLGENYDNEKLKKQIFDLYLLKARENKINNWDLVDLSAPRIIGNFLLDKDREILYKLAKSNNLWEKRIAIISTAAFISQNDFSDTIKISEILLNDKHDLIHKAVGWMLREIGKKDVKILEEFLKKHYKNMPRTMLRYSIEKFDEKERKKWLNGEK